MKICLQFTRIRRFSVDDNGVVAAMRLMKRTGHLDKARWHCQQCLDLVVQEWKIEGVKAAQNVEEQVRGKTKDVLKCRTWALPHDQESLLILFLRFGTKLEEILGESNADNFLIVRSDREAWRAWLRQQDQ